jgi:hypothetical protein
MKDSIDSVALYDTSFTNEDFKIVHDISQPLNAIDRRALLQVSASMFVSLLLPTNAQAQSVSKTSPAVEGGKISGIEMPARKERSIRPTSQQVFDYLRGSLDPNMKKIDGFVDRLARVSKDSPSKLAELFSSVHRVPVPPTNFGLSTADQKWLYGELNEKGFVAGENGERPWPSMSMAFFEPAGQSGEDSIVKGVYSAFYIQTSQGKLTCLPAPILNAKLKLATKSDLSLTQRLAEGIFATIEDIQHGPKNSEAPAHAVTSLRSSELHGHWGSVPFLLAGRDRKGVLDRRHPSYLGGVIFDYSNNSALFSFLKERITRNEKDEKTRLAMIAGLRHANIMFIMSENKQWASLEHAGLFDGVLGAPTFRSIDPEKTSEPEQNVVGQALYPIQLTDGPSPRWALVLTKPETLRLAQKLGEQKIGEWK